MFADKKLENLKHPHIYTVSDSLFKNINHIVIKLFFVGSVKNKGAFVVNILSNTIHNFNKYI